MPTGWAKNGTVLFNCLNVMTFLLLVTSVSRHLYTVLSTFFYKYKPLTNKENAKKRKKRDQNKKT